MDDGAILKIYGNSNLPGGTEDRTLVTFGLFAYNQEKYIREAVEGAFSQTYSPLEIILSDDCSSDRTVEIMEEMAREYRGPHQVVVRRGTSNLGVARHFDELIRNAKGWLFLAAAGDDISHAHRTSVCVATARKIKDAGLIEVGCNNFSSDSPYHESDQELKHFANPATRLFSIQDVLYAKISGFIGAGRAYRREDYLRFSPLIECCPEEDTPALFRCLYNRNGALVKQNLVLRRIHETNLSSQKSLVKMDFAVLAAQYKSDFDQALERNLVDMSDRQKINNGLQRYIFRKQCAIDVYSGFRGTIKFIDVVRSDHFSFREKVYFLRKAIRARLCTNE
jgi:glycosyltransferase involved in cell wall biosynthesis